MDLIGHRDENHLAIIDGGRGANRRADLLAPQNGARCRVKRQGFAKRGRGVDARAVG